jgi:methylmalonyl-CoA mutase
VSDVTDSTAPDSGGLALAAQFPAVTRQQWQRLVAKVLKSTSDSPERELVTVTADGIEIDPLYVASVDQQGAGQHGAGNQGVGNQGAGQHGVGQHGVGHQGPGYPGETPFVRGATAAGNRGGWDVRQRHEHPDPAVAREQIMEDLEGGVGSLWLGLGDGRIPVGALPDVLADVYLGLAGVVLDAGGQFAEAADVFLGTAERRDVPAGALTGCLGADPLGVQARTGAEGGLDDAVVLAVRCSAGFPGVRAIVVDALPFHEAGGTDAEELGCALAAGVEYLRAMREAGLPADAAFGQLEFRYAATADQFATIAKLRAARRAWARVAQQCGVTSGAGGQRQHAVSSWPMLTRRDPWNNILRATLACFAAGVGGADAVTIAPFDAAIGQPDRLARRVARNLHALLVEESQVARVIDPAGGSWYVEDLTGQLALHAWTWFQDIERAGGLRAALASGLVAGRLAVSRDARRDALARRREAVTGVSEFPHAGETLLSRPANDWPAADRPAADGPAADRPAVGAGPVGLPRIRWAQWYEELRDRADAYARKTGAPPELSLILLDGSRPSLARAGQVAALLAPAGITTVLTPGTVTPGDGVLTPGTVTPGDGALSPGTVTPGDGALSPGTVAVVCGSPDAAEDDVREAVAAARAQGAATVVVAAGDPAGDQDVPGAAERVTDGMDVLAFGDRMLTALGVPR